MRNAFIMIFVANLLLALAALVVGPPQVAIHFGAGGEANGWAPAVVSAILMIGVNVMVFASFYFIPRILQGMSPQWINVPNKEYWMRDENRARMEELFAESMYQFGAATHLLLFLVSLLALDANMSEPVRLNDGIFWVCFALYMTYTAYWTVKLVRAFRLPKERNM